VRLTRLLVASIRASLRQREVSHSEHAERSAASQISQRVGSGRGVLRSYGGAAVPRYGQCGSGVARVSSSAYCTQPYMATDNCTGARTLDEDFV